jgi:replicative DNA helicase
MTGDEDQPGYPLRDLLGSFLDRLQTLYDSRDDESPFPWGYRDALAMFDVPASSGLIVLTSPPAFGTESVALRLVHQIGVVSKMPVLVLSTGSMNEIAERLVVLDSALQEWKIDRGHLVEKEWEAVGSAISHLADSPIRIDRIQWDFPWEVATKVRHFALHSEVGLFVLDAFSPLVGASPSHDWRAQLVDIQSALKEAASDLGVPVMVMRPNDARFSARERRSLDSLVFELTKEWWTNDKS